MSASAEIIASPLATQTFCMWRNVMAARLGSIDALGFLETMGEDGRLSRRLRTAALNNLRSAAFYGSAPPATADRAGAEPNP